MKRGCCRSNSPVSKRGVAQQHPSFPVPVKREFYDKYTDETVAAGEKCPGRGRSLAKDPRSPAADRPHRLCESRLLCALQETVQAAQTLVILTVNRESIRAQRRELAHFYPDLAMRELYPASLIHGQVDTRNEQVMAERAAALEMIVRKEPGIIFATAEAAIQKLPQPESWSGKT